MCFHRELSKFIAAIDLSITSPTRHVVRVELVGVINKFRLAPDEITIELEANANLLTYML